MVNLGGTKTGRRLSLLGVVVDAGITIYITDYARVSTYRRHVWNGPAGSWLGQSKKRKLYQQEWNQSAEKMADSGLIVHSVYQMHPSR